MRSIRSFLIDINLVLPQEINKKEVKVELRADNGMPLEESEIVFSKTELYAQGKKRSKKDKNMLRFYYLGSFKESSTKDEEHIIIKISSDTLHSKEVHMKLRRGYSSFVDVKKDSKKN